MPAKKSILDNICYTDLVYGRINKKLVTNFSRPQIEIMLLEVIKSTTSKNIKKIGKNYYISNSSHNIRVTINSFTYRVITVDRIKVSL
jgi:hypothetical protein